MRGSVVIEGDRGGQSNPLISRAITTYVGIFVRKIDYGDRKKRKAGTRYDRPVLSNNYMVNSFVHEGL